MHHTIEELIRRLEQMKDKALTIHRLRNQYAEISGKTYDHETCTRLLAELRQDALGIAHDNEFDTIPTEMEYKKL
jgi:hypothetical protein|tara:strand:+ start:281 stop:505 length:225 start_codon:yes stop_codon:yes gene_type:complete